MKTDIKQDPKTHVIVQELELVKILAGNDSKARNKALKNLHQWFLRRSKKMPFTEDDFQRIWKGLFYCMWMSDKPLVQEDCAEKISKLVHFPDLSTSILFFKAGMFILGQEWNGIDQLRLDKFLMLVRKLLRETLRALQNHSFTDKSIQKFNDALSEMVLNQLTPVGLFMHFIEIFMEELAKVTQGKIHNHSVAVFLQPFIKCLVTSHDGREIEHIRKHIFSYLIRQSDLGLNYQEKYEAWKKQGFPGSINSMQKIVIDEEQDSEDEMEDTQSVDPKEKPLDPRAGRVNVEIPQIHFSPKEIANILLHYKFDKSSSTQTRNIIKMLAQQFKRLSQGDYPLGIKKIDVKDKHEDINIRKAAKNLIKFEQKLLVKNKKRKYDKENNEKDPVEKKRAKLNTNVEEVDKSSKKLKNKESKTNGTVTSKSNKKEKNKKQETNKSLFGDKDNQLENNKVKDEKKKIYKPRPDQLMEVVDTVSKKSNDGSLNSMDHKISSSIMKAKHKLKGKNDKKLKSKSKTGFEASKDMECMFKRNSGTWVVYELEKKSASQRSVDRVNPNKLNETNKKSKLPKSNTKEISSSTYNSSKSGLVTPVELPDTTTKKKELFPKSEWEEPLQEGEYEICIPSKKYIGKMKKLAKNENKSVQELINMTLTKIRGKSRTSLDSQLVNNPFSKPNSAKKVKINVRLNQSQDIDEHIANVKSSPGIPYDATKKPSKPLLKPTGNSTPINPFYKRRINVF